MSRVQKRVISRGEFSRLKAISFRVKELDARPWSVSLTNLAKKQDGPVQPRKAEPPTLRLGMKGRLATYLLGKIRLGLNPWLELPAH